MRTTVSHEFGIVLSEAQHQGGAERQEEQEYGTHRDEVSVEKRLNLLGLGTCFILCAKRDESEIVMPIRRECNEIKFSLLC